jgi:uncharacterized protein DUF6355
MQQKQVKRTTKIAAILAVTALGGCLLAGEAVASTATTAARCGYYVEGIEAYYNHCTSDGSHIVIREDRVGEFDKNVCVGPGVTHLGTAVIVRYARYIGQLC